MKLTTLFFLFLIYFFQSSLFANKDTVGFLNASQKFNKEKFYLVATIHASVYAGSFIGLNQLWYKDYPRSSFHFFDDSQEWLQMDKVGHVGSAYYLSRISFSLWNWAGLTRNKTIFYGSAYSFAYLSTIEILDGFSRQWGFSVSDMAANTIGVGLMMGQEFLWDQQRVSFKYSYAKSRYANDRPELLGSNRTERFFKDYNGQTYWLSANIGSFIKKETTFPKWLNIAVGYGVDGLTGAFENPSFNSKGFPIPSYKRTRQYYLSLDIDLTKIKVKSKLLKTLFQTVAFIKIPAPTLQFGNSVKLYPLYF